MPENHEIRELMFGMMNHTDLSEKPLIIPIDQYFVVQGIGLVGIGYVQSGQIKKHDTIEVISLGEKGIVRSLQVMDDNVDAAYSGDRVVGRITNISEDCIKVNWENPLWVRAEKVNEIILTQLDANPMRIIGTVKEIMPE